MARLAGAWLLTWLALGPGSGAVAADDDLIARGEYVFHAAGCFACHTDEKGGGERLAGGRPLVTPLGTFYAPNITSDPTHGIGRWSEADFVRALTQGLAPDGSPYYPAFPYTAYAGMRAEDLRALWAYLRGVPAVARPNRPHELPWYLRWRVVNWPWRWLYFTPGAFAEDPTRDPVWNRGAYIARALSHCGECHTPRNLLGGLDPGRHYAGASEGPQGGAVPNITPDRDTGIGRWRVADLAYFLSSGATPDGDYTGGLMAEVVEHGTAHLTESDRLAVATYVRSLPPIHNPVTRADRRKSKSRGEFE
jgi:mono/diheme cytochrome c family protein